MRESVLRRDRGFITSTQNVILTAVASLNVDLNKCTRKMPVSPGGIGELD